MIIRYFFTVYFLKFGLFFSVKIDMIITPRLISLYIGIHFNLFTQIFMT